MTTWMELEAVENKFKPNGLALKIFAIQSSEQE